MNFKFLLAFALVLVASQAAQATPIDDESFEVYDSDLLEKIKEIFDKVSEQVKHAIESANSNLDQAVKRGLEVVKNALETVKKETEVKANEVEKALEEAREKGAQAKECAEKHLQDVESIRASMLEEVKKCTETYHEAVTRAGQQVTEVIAKFHDLGKHVREIIQNCKSEHKGDPKAMVQCVVKKALELRQEVRNVLGELREAVRAAEPQVREAVMDARECVKAAAKESADKFAKVAQKIRECITSDELDFLF